MSYQALTQIPKRHIFCGIIGTLLACSSNYLESAPTEECQFEVTGTTVPNSSGTPVVINEFTGTVIFANFFGSGAIDPPYYDGGESVSVCVNHPDTTGQITARITTDVGLDNDALIKGYPQFLIGTKFGNQSETSFRYYDNSALPIEQQWPVTSTGNNDSGTPFQFANLEFVSHAKNIGLPAFTAELPSIEITLDIDEQNVIQAERDVMLESWFFDTSANSTIIGNNIATGQPIAGTLNNIVGIGHPHYPQLDNTLLEMMVHIGPLSRNDISKATRNPGQNQLTEIYSGKDFDNDGIDDHFDVDSHINVNNSSEPRPGKYSSGIDNNGDGIDDADILPVLIGDFIYSIWYGESFLSPIVIFSRETNNKTGIDFDPDTPDTDLTTEGIITLDWNLFLEYTMVELEPLLLSQNVSWVIGAENPFPKINSASGAIGGIELGIEPQTNNPTDQPYIASVNTFDVRVDGVQVGLTTSDSMRSSSVASIIAALEDYAADNGSYRVSGTGYADRGQGWFHYDQWAYNNSIFSGLAGFLTAPPPADPLHSDTSAFSTYDFLVYPCKDRIAVFAHTDSITADQDHQNWWTDNNCNTTPANKHDRSFFILSAPLSTVFNNNSFDDERNIALTDIINAFEQYASDNGSYFIPGTGYANNSQGWFHYDKGAYNASIYSGLAPYLTGIPKDPLQQDINAYSPHDFLVYRCLDRVAVFAQTSSLTADDSDSTWWNDNNCNPSPFENHGRTFFKLSQPLNLANPSNDIQRQTNVSDVIAALEAYASDNGTYKVTGTGHNDRAQGWFHHDQGAYNASIYSGLSTYLSNIPIDPLHTNFPAFSAFDLMIYRCKDRVAVFSYTDALTPTTDDQNWWATNNCTTTPIDRHNHNYFLISNPL